MYPFNYETISNLNLLNFTEPNYQKTKVLTDFSH